MTSKTASCLRTYFVLFSNNLEIIEIVCESQSFGDILNQV